jgi:hypothetical protein
MTAMEVAAGRCSGYVGFSEGVSLMDGMRFVVQLHGAGTLAADQIMHYKLPCDATLVQVDMVATTAAVGTLKIGTDADDDGYMTAVTFGASNVPVTKGRGAFTGALMVSPYDPAECPHFPKDTILKLTLTHNSMIHPDVALTFLEG